MNTRSVTNQPTSVTLQALERERQRTEFLKGEVARQTYWRTKAEEAEAWQAQANQLRAENQTLERQNQGLRQVVMEFAMNNGTRELAEYALWAVNQENPVYLWGALTVFVRSAGLALPDAGPMPLHAGQPADSVGAAA